MTRIVVEEGGQRRAFRLTEGKVALGSGEEAKVRLVSADVAALHADLELAGGRLVLVPRPGVLPPKVNGRPIAGPVVLERGARIEIGSARLVVEPEASEPAAPPAARAAPAGAGVARVARGGASAASPRASRARARKASLPPWMLGGGILLVVVVALFAARGLWSQGASSANPVFPLVKARQALLEGHVQTAEDELDRLTPAQLVGDVRAQAESLRLEIQRRRREAAERREQQEADEYFATQLERYEGEYLQGNPDSGRIRVFLERAREFQNRWPTHPENEWVRRQLGRFRGVVDLETRRTYDELLWKLKTLTWSFPRDYGEVFRVLDDWEKGASGAEVQQAAELRAKQEEERDAYWEDRTQQVMWHWDRGEKGQAVEWLVQLLTKIGDPERERQAAQILVGLPGVEGWLRAYAQDKPEKFAALTKNPIVANYCREQGIS